MPTIPHLPLGDGASIPQLGFGVYKIPEAETVDAVHTALDAGYRHIDTAAFYGNERAVGEAVRRSGLPREEVYVTTKVWWSENGYDSALRAVDASLDRLGFDRVDLFLIHWRALERVRDEGRARSIGVSNFHIHHLQRLASETGTVPAVNQVELHPWLPQSDVRAYDDANGIVTEAWSPLARGRVLGDPTLAALAQKHGATPAQVVLRWQLQLGVVVIPKSSAPERIRENRDLFGFELDADDLAAIATLESGERTGKDPDDLG
ncbi:oxidoreductase [Leifsonia xyli subsp. cynodontis DSM 46306]|uniref:NADP-dependent oxidoreductase domain-containing protein n=1 Tax=Leifsonia xyli subsp. cynodontis DSM 46306 TaxID=1389489 RepID=U3P694_LEIXC|nr:aldo/keto reductase [Leifsonia xyli]AGW40422.1 oxidoreductase [Leifsonia xyli subsp. cynodontis DSM 46306]